MERFEINYNLNGRQAKLDVEQMDIDNCRFSVERNGDDDRHLYDGRPLLIERAENGRWRVLTQDSWGLDDIQIREIGNLIDAHVSGESGISIGVNAK